MRHVAIVQIMPDALPVHLCDSIGRQQLPSDPQLANDYNRNKRKSLSNAPVAERLRRWRGSFPSLDAHFLRCAAPCVLLAAGVAIIFAAQVSTATEPAGAKLPPTPCNELQRRLDQLRAEALTVSSQLASQCAPRTNETFDVDAKSTAAGLSTSSWVSIGAASGAVILLAATLVLMRRRYKLLRDVLVMAFTEVAELVGSVFMDLADLATDCLTCYQVVGGEVAVPSELYKTMYPAIAALGTLAVVTSLVYRVRNARLMRQQMKELTAEQAKAVNDTASENRAQEEDAGSASPISPGELVAGSARFASRRGLAASENPDRTGSASPGSPAEHDARVVRRQLTLRGLGRKATLLQPVGPSQSLAREEVGLATRQARRYEYELKQSHRVLIMQALHLLTVVVQGKCTM